MSDERFIYHAQSRINKGNILETIASKDSETITEVLLSMVFYESDLFFCLDILSKCFEFEDPMVRGMAVLCIGHLARIHGDMPKEIPISLITRALRDSNKDVQKQGKNALGDMKIFIPNLERSIINHIENN